MTNPIQPQRSLRLAVPAALLPPGLKPDAEGCVELPLNFARRDIIRAEWALRDAGFGTSVTNILARGADAPATCCGVLLFIGLGRALPSLTIDDAFDLVPIDDAESMGSFVETLSWAYISSRPNHQNATVPEAGDAADPLPETSTGSAPGPSLVTTSA